MDKQEELHKAAGSGDVAAIRRLVGQGANVNWHNPNEYGRTPLHEAAGYGRLEAVRALLGARALVEARDKEGRTPLHKAASYGNVEVVRALLDAGAKIEAKDKDGRTPLHFAADIGKVEAVRALLDRGAKIDAKENDGRTPLHLAAWNDHDRAVRALLDAGAKIEAKDNAGETPLHHATAGGDAEATQVLLEAGADVAVKNKDGMTPLDDAFVGSRILTLFGWGVKRQATRIAAVKGVIRAAADQKLEQERKARESELAARWNALQLQQQEESRRRNAEAAVLKQREEALLAKEREVEAQRQRLAQHMAVPPAAIFPAAPRPAGPPMYQGGRISLGTELISQVMPLNSRLAKAGLAAVGQVVQGVLTCNPVTLVTACATLVRVVNAEVQVVQCCKQRVGRVLVRCGAMMPALQKLEQVLVPPQPASLEVSFVESISKALVMLAQVLMGLEQVLVQLEGGSGSRLVRMMRAIKRQGYQQELDALEQELRDCLSHLMAIIGICSFTKQVSDALVGKDELRVACWAEQNSEDRKADLQQLEAQVLAVAGGVQALQQQLEQQALELDGQRIELQDVLGWLQRMNASSAVIADHLQHLHCKVDSIQDDVTIIKDQMEKLMLQGRKGKQWCPTDRLPNLAIPASCINADAVQQAMDDAATGAFGKVVKAKLNGVSDVAVKVFNYRQSGVGVRDCKEAVKEAVLLSMARHPQVVECYGLVFDPSSGSQRSIHGSLVMEWVGGGTLHTWMQEEEGEELRLRERLQVALQVAAGLQHLHSKKLVHGDLKPQNVLVTAELLPNQRVPQAKICDFGLSKYTSTSMLSTHTSQQVFAQAYTPLYTSPQRLNDYAIRTPADDVYAFGIMLHFIATSTTPMDHIPLAELRQAVISGKRPDIDNWAAEAVGSGAESQAAVRQYCQLAKDCWSPDELLRPDSTTILRRLRALAQVLDG